MSTAPHDNNPKLNNIEALRSWTGAAAGWTKWEPVHNKALADASQRMLDLAGVTTGSRVIDIACGAGDQSLAAARRAGPTGYVLATDIAQPMLDFVRSQALSADLGNISTHACPAEALPQDQAQFDAAICRLGLMLLPDPVAAVEAVYNILRPQGRFGALVFAPADKNPAHSEPVVIFSRHANKALKSTGPGLFSFSDPARLIALFEAAGFSDVSLQTIDTTLSLRSVDEMIQMIREAFGDVRVIIADQPQPVQDAAWAEARRLLARFETSEGFAAPCQVHVIGGRKAG